MSPCCLAAAAATAAMTALIVAGLSALVLVTDGFGLGVLAGTLLAVAFQSAGWIGPCPRLLHAVRAVLAARAAWLLATTRRPLVVATCRLVRARVARAVRRLTPPGGVRPVHTCCRPDRAHAAAPKGDATGRVGLHRGD
jgi:hypothetical protein